MKKLLVATSMSCFFACSVFGQEGPQRTNSDPINIPKPSLQQSHKPLRRRSTSRGSAEAYRLAEQHKLPKVNELSSNLARIDGLPFHGSPRSVSTSPRHQGSSSRLSKSVSSRTSSGQQ
jgi:hypothetical protein